jgi:hypothetical protein
MNEIQKPKVFFEKCNYNTEVDEFMKYHWCWVI